MGLSLVVSLSLTLFQPAAATGTNNINFQARLEEADGAIAPDGNYNIEFKIYDASASSGSSQGSCTGDVHCLWTEDYTGGAKVRVANGYLTVSLGSITAFPGTMPWDQPLYLTMNIGGTSTPSWDGEMDPRLPLTAVPYAFQAAKATTLQATSGGNLGILHFGSITHATNDITLPDATGTVCLEGDSAGCGFAAANGTSGAYIQNTTSLQTNANFFIQSTGIGSPTAVIERLTGQTAPLLVFDDDSGNPTSGFNAAGNLFFQSGSNASTLTQHALTGAHAPTFELPDVGGTQVICTVATCTGGAGGSLGGSGTQYYVAVFDSGGNAITDSSIYDDGTFVGIGTTTATSGRLSVVSDLDAAQSGIYLQGADNATAPVAQIRLGATPSTGGSLIDFRDSSGALLATFSTDGSLLTGATETVGSTTTLSGTTGQLNVQAAGGANVGQVIRAGSSQTGNLLENQDSSGVALSGFDHLGQLFFNGGSFIGTIKQDPIGQNTTYELPDNGNANETICLVSTCTGGAGGSLSGTGTANYVARWTGSNSLGKGLLYDTGTGGFVGVNTITNSGELSIQSSGAGVSALAAFGAASATVPVAVITGGATPGSGADLLDLASDTSVVASFDSAGNFHTTGSATVDNGLTVAGGADVLGTTSINTSGVANTDINTGTNTGNVSIGNSTGTFALTSNTLNINASGVITGVAGLTFASGNFDQSASSGIFKTGTGAVSLNGDTTVASGKSLTIASFGSGVVQSSSAGLLSSSALNLAAGSSLITGVLPIANGGTNNSSFTTNGVTFFDGSKLASTAAGTGGQILLANNLSIPTFTTVSGDITISSAGVTTIGAGKVTNADLVNDHINFANGTNTTVSATTAALGGTALSVNVVSNPTFAGDVAVQGSGGLTIGTSSVTGQLVLQDGSGNAVTIAPDAQSSALSLTIPTAASGSDTICLEATANCALANAIAGTGTNNYVARFTGAHTLGTGLLYDTGGFAGVNITSQLNTSTFGIQGASGEVALSIEGASGQDIADFLDSSGALAAGFNSSGKLYFNNGSNANLYASASNTLKTDGNLIAAGNLTVTLATAANNTAVCSNGGLLSSCQSSFEATTGNDFIKNQTTGATVQTASEFFQGASGNVTSTIRGESGNSADILDLQSGAAGNAIVASFDANGNETLSGGATLRINGTGTTSDLIDLGANIPANGQNLLVYHGGTFRTGLGIQANVFRIFTSTGAITSFGHVSSSNGSTYTQDVEIDANGNLEVGTAAAATARVVIQGQDATSAHAALNVTNSTPTSLFYVRDDGNVGVGTTSPSALFSVGSSSQFQVNGSGNVTAVLGAAANNTAVCSNGGVLSACQDSFETTNGTDFIQNNPASQQTSASFNIAAGSGKVAATIQGASTGSTAVAVIKAGGGTNTGDLLDLQSGGNTVASFDNSGNLTIGAVGSTTGTIKLATAGSSNLDIILPGVVTGSGNASFILPTEAASGSPYTLCTIDTCAVSSGGAGYINNIKPSVGIGGVQSANFYIQSADTATGVTAAIAAASGQTGDLLELQNNSGAVLSGFTNTGKLYFNNGSNANLYASAANTLKTDGNLIVAGTGSVLGDFSVNGSKFQVTASNGNTSVAGTLDVTGLSSLNGGVTVSGGAASINDNSNNNTTINTGSSTGSVTIGGANAGTISLQSGGAINLGSVGSSTAASTIHIADTSNGTGTQTVTIGSTAKSTNSVTLQAGAGTVVINNTATTVTGTFQVGNGTTNPFSVSSTGVVTYANAASSGSTLVCSNSNQLTSCTNSYETTSGNDFIKNQTTAAAIQSANFFFQANGATVAATIRGNSANSQDILDLQTGDTGNAIVASFDHAGNLSAGTINGAAITSTTFNTATISGGTLSGGTLSGGTFSGGSVSGGSLTSTTVNSLGVTSSAITATGALSVSSGGSGQLTLSSATGDIGTGSNTINGQTISSAASFTGTLAFNTLGSAGSTVLCQNASKQISSCSSSFETTSGNDFIKNQTTAAAIQSANFYFQANGATVAATIRGNSGVSADILDLLGGASGSTVASVDKSGNVLGAAFDAQTSSALNIGTTNATSIGLKKSTTITGTSGVALTVAGVASQDIADFKASGGSVVANFDSNGVLTAVGATLSGQTNGGNGGIITGDGSGNLSSVTLDLGTTTYITGQLKVANGGTGVASTTAYGLLAGGTTSTGAFQNVGTGSNGNILKSNGSGALPTWVSNTAANTCSDCLRQAPTTNAQNTIQPATSGVVGLTVQETNTGTAANILEIRNAGGGTLLDSFDSTGALNLGVTAVPIGSSIDLGSSSKLFRSGYFATSVLTQTIDVPSTGQLNIGTSGSPTTSQITLNQGTQLASGKSLSFASGSGTFDQSSSTGTFKTGTGIVSLNGSTQVAAGKNLTLLSGNGQIVVQGYGASGSSAESITANSLTTGNFLNLQNSGSTYTGTAILANLAAGGSGTFTGNFVDFQNNDVSQFKVASDGTIYVQGHQGVTDSTCSSGEVLTGASYYGGIATGGTCSAPSGFVTLQNAYNNSGTTQPQIQIDSGLNSTNGLTISDDGTAAGGVHAPVSGNIFQVTNYNNGGTVYLGVASSGITTSGTLTVNGGSPSTIAGELKATNTTANGGVSIIASGITETNSLKVGSSFQFGVDASGNISTTGSLAIAPGGANPNTFNVSNNSQVSQTYKSSSSASASSISAINGSAGTGVIVNGIALSLSDTAGASGSNTINGISLGSVTHNTAADIYNGLTFGTGYDNIINAGSVYTVTGTGAVTEGGALTVTAGGASIKAASGNILTLQNTFSSVVTVDNSGNVSAGTYNGQTISSAASFTGTVALATLGTANSANYLCYNSSNQIASCNTTGTGAAFIQGGNHFGASTAGILGTLDSGSTLNVVAGGATQFIVGTNGTLTFDNANNTITTQSTGNNLAIDTFSGATLSLGASSGAINLGNSNSTTVDSFTAGAYRLQITNTGLGINNGGTAPDADISFGNSADHTIDVLQSSSGNGHNLTIQSGSGVGTGSNNGGSLILQAGAGHGSGGDGSVIVKGATTTSGAAFQIQNSGGTALLVADTSASMRVSIGTIGTVNSTTPSLVVAKAEIQTGLYVGVAAGNIQNNGSGGALRFSGTARNSTNVTLTPEYPGAVLTGVGGSNVGVMTSDFCSFALNINGGTGTPDVCASSNDAHNYYSWTTSQASAQDYDIFVRWQVPSNYDTADALPTIKFYGWRTSTANDAVSMTVKNDAGTTCGTLTSASGSNGFWTQATYNNSGGSCSITAGSTVLTFDIHLSAATGDFARVGEINLTYNAIF
ncbi:MAG TPA: hypothetical protein VHB51_04385 [Candidatus Saccharimonadales bacterium]|nr:hypothetical protein [Candidatus Saccharimonadales bacterium]